MSQFEPILTEQRDQLKVRVYENREAMGKDAAEHAAAKIRELLGKQDRVRMVFAAAPSQNEFLEALTKAEGIDWRRITAFHMDEYIGLPAGAKERFSQFLKDAIFDKVNPGEVHLIGMNDSTEEEIRRYTELIQEAPIDIICLGIGENGHIAFNDPPVADFDDPEVIKPVELDAVCRQQQVNDGAFPTLDDVPTHALTLTIPTLMSGKHLYCMVPGPTKKEAVYKTLNGPITTECPASILRKHPDCTLYTDKEAYGM